MNKSESKYFNTAAKMDEALLALLEKKDFAYITVKEICQTAGVNRSTFYLHYETVGDLLAECVEYTNRKCAARMEEQNGRFEEDIATADLDKLIFLTPRYLTPYLEFVRENKRMFRVVLRHKALMDAERTFERMFTDIFSPVMDRFHIPEAEKRYVLAYYIHGLIAVVSQWLREDCREPVEQIVDLCMRCVFPARGRRSREGDDQDGGPGMAG